MKSVKSKIRASMLIVVAAFMIVLGVVACVLTSQSSRTLLRDTMKSTVTIAAESVSNKLEAYRNLAIALGTQPALSNPELDNAAKVAAAQNWAEQNGLTRANVIGTDGKGLTDGNDYSARAYFQQAMQGQTYVSEPVDSAVTGEKTIIVAAPLWQNGVAGSTVVGVVYVVPQETFLNEIMSTMLVAENANAYMIDQNGTTIADTTMDTINVQNIEEEAKTDSSKSELAQIHSAMRAGKTDSVFYKLDGVEEIAAYAPIEGSNGWSVCLTDQTNDFMTTTKTAIIVVIVLVLVSLLVSLLLANKLANSIGKPIELCSKRLLLLSQGDLDSPVPEVTSKDETGTLAQTTKTIVEALSSMLDDLEYQLAEMSNGNMAVDFKNRESFVGSFETLAKDVEMIKHDLSQTMSQIEVASSQVAAGSDQVSSGAQALAQGATEQASSVQELAATITNISDSVKRTAENARQANEHNEQAGSLVNESNEKMQEMLSAMAEIQKCSNEISKIIKSIEDIAFQTNILALNAAVEAARAGAAGKGFAVVADEVRNLASKSAEASKNTAALIENSLAAVQHGNEIAEQTAEKLRQTVEKARGAIELVEQIATEANEQAESVSQVTLGVDQISGVVQTNSATAEESAAASEELSGQAAMLKSLVDHFTLMEDVQAAADVPMMAPRPEIPETGVSKY